MDHGRVVPSVAVEVSLNPGDFGNWLSCFDRFGMADGSRDSWTDDSHKKTGAAWIEDSSPARTFSISFAHGKRVEAGYQLHRFRGGVRPSPAGDADQSSTMRSPNFDIRFYNGSSRWAEDELSSPELAEEDGYENVSDVSSDVSEWSELDVLIRPDSFNIRQSSPASSFGSPLSASSPVVGSKRSHDLSSAGSSVIPSVPNGEVEEQPDEDGGRLSKRIRYDDEDQAETSSTLHVTSSQPPSDPDPPSSASSRSSRYEQEREEKRQRWQRLARTCPAPQARGPRQSSSTLQQHSSSQDVHMTCPTPVVPRRDVRGQVEEGFMYVDEQHGSSSPVKHVSSAAKVSLSPSDVIDLKTSVSKAHVQIYEDWNDRDAIPTPGAPPSRRPSEALSSQQDETEDEVQLVRTTPLGFEGPASKGHEQCPSDQAEPSPHDSRFDGTSSETSLPFDQDSFEVTDRSDVEGEAEEEGESPSSPTDKAPRIPSVETGSIDHARFRGQCDDWPPQSDNVSVKSEEDENPWGGPRCLAFFDSDVVLDLPDPDTSVDEGPGADKDSFAAPRRRLENMLNKEQGMLEEIVDMEAAGAEKVPIRSDIELGILNSVVHWILTFDTHISQYPPTSPSTRFRAAYLFSTFFRLRHFPTNAADWRKQKHARFLGVASYLLALKTDVDFNYPLFVVPSRSLGETITKSGWAPIHIDEIVVYERVLLEALSHHTTLCTPFDFMEELSQCVPSLVGLAEECPEIWYNLVEGWGQDVLACLTDQAFVKFPPSTLAAATFSLHLQASLFNPNDTPSSGSWRSRSRSTSMTPSREPRIETKPAVDEVELWSQVSADTVVKLNRWMVIEEICDALMLSTNELEVCRDWLDTV